MPPAVTRSPRRIAPSPAARGAAGVLDFSPSRRRTGVAGCGPHDGVCEGGIEGPRTGEEERPVRASGSLILLMVDALCLCSVIKWGCRFVGKDMTITQDIGERARDVGAPSTL